MHCLPLLVLFIEDTAGACQYWGKGNQRLFTLEFDRLRKSMSVMVNEDNSSTANKLLVKVLNVWYTKKILNILFVRIQPLRITTMTGTPFHRFQLCLLSGRQPRG